MPFAGYKDFGACVAAQRKKGKSPESAKKICGALQARAEGKAANAAQVPQEFKPHVNRSVKTLDFLKQVGVLADDNENNNEIDNYNDNTSLDNQIPSDTATVLTTGLIYSDPESYSDKVTRIMDEYGVDEDDAKQIVGKLIHDEMQELDRREYELTKQLEIEKKADMITSDDAVEPQPEQQQQQPEQQEEQNEDVTDRVGESNTE